MAHPQESYLYTKVILNLSEFLKNLDELDAYQKFTSYCAGIGDILRIKFFPILALRLQSCLLNMGAFDHLTHGGENDSAPMIEWKI